MQKQHQQHIRLNHLLLLHGENLRRLTWRKEIEVELLKGLDEKLGELSREHQIDQFWNDQLRSCSDRLVSRQMDKNVGANMNENDGENVKKSVCNNVVQSIRNAPIAGDIRRQFPND